MRALPLFALFLASGPASAGVLMEMTDRDLTDAAAKPEVQKLYFENGQFRVDSIEDGRLDSSVLFKNRTMYAIDHGEKQYTAMDQAAMDRAAAQLARMRKEMEAQMAAMPPEQRAMVEKMLGEQGLPGGQPAKQRTRTFKDTGRSDSVSGRACRVWEIAVNGVRQEELCVVAPGSLPGGDALMNAMRELAEMSRGFFEKVGADEDVMAEAWADLEKVKGIPILTREFEDGKAVAESRLTALREQALGAATFDVPKGFREEKFDLGGPADD
jgi:hypothetical protein